MKPIYTILFSIIFMCNISAQRAIKLPPIGYFFGYYSMSYEHTIDTNLTIQFGANYIFQDDQIFLGLYRCRGFGFDIGLRQYTEFPLEGFYFHPFLSYSNLNSPTIKDRSEQLFNYSLLTLELRLGHQWVSKNGFIADLGFGLAYKMELSKDKILTEDFGGFKPRITFMLGQKL
jgi:hypothetical protein